MKMEKNLVKMEKVEKMEKILAILEKTIVTIRRDAITDTYDPDPPSVATGNGASVRVKADAVGLKIRGVPGVPQHRIEGVLVANALASKKLKQVYTTIARYEKGDKTQYHTEDIQYRIFEHICDFMYKSLQLFIPGDVKDTTDLYIWKLRSEYFRDDGLTTVKFCWSQFKFQCDCSAELMVKEGSDYILIVRCSTHRRTAITVKLLAMVTF